MPMATGGTITLAGAPDNGDLGRLQVQLSLGGLMGVLTVNNFVGNKT